MIAVAGRGARLATALKASSQTVASSGSPQALGNSATPKARLLRSEAWLPGSSSTLLRTALKGGSVFGGAACQTRFYAYDANVYPVKSFRPRKNRPYIAHGGGCTRMKGDMWDFEPLFTDNPISRPLASSFTTAFVKPEAFREIRKSVGSGHYQLQMGNFNDYRHKQSHDPTYDAREDLEGKKAFSYMFIGTGLAASGYTVKAIATSVASYLMPAADVVAAGITEVSKDAIPEGSSLTFKWRGKPLFIKHRTAEQIEAERKTDLAVLRDPQHDSDRVIDPKFLVVVGICTHLGCVPIHNAGEFGGFYCPCHGSHYDNSGRIRLGPAPANLEVPPYKFPEPGLIVVGA